MPKRRIKSIMHGSAESTRVYHHEHRSKKGRKVKDILAKEFKEKKEKLLAKEAKEIIRDLI